MHKLTTAQQGAAPGRLPPVCFSGIVRFRGGKRRVRYCVARQGLLAVLSREVGVKWLTTFEHIKRDRKHNVKLL